MMYNSFDDQIQCEEVFSDRYIFSDEDIWDDWEDEDDCEVNCENA